MQEAFPDRELLDTEHVARYLGVSPVTIWRWCREGSLPCLKIGRQWRIRRSALEAFLERSERSETLTGRLRAFLEVPDNVLGIAQTAEMMHGLDTAFFRVGEAHGGTLVKFLAAESESEGELRDRYEDDGLEVSRLEEEERFRFIVESEPTGRRVEELERLVAQMSDKDRSAWICFNWKRQMDLASALRQQEQISRFVEDSLVVIQTNVLEELLDEWPGAMLREAQTLHSGTIWLSEAGLALNRVVAPLQP